MSDLLYTFSVHNHTNINQLHNFKQAKKNVWEGEILISEDCSKNYSLKHQNEIMSSHWSQDMSFRYFLLLCITKSMQKFTSSTIRVISKIWMQLLFFTNTLFWVSGDNMGLKDPANSCKQVAFSTGVQGKSKRCRALKVVEGPYIWFK